MRVFISVALVALTAFAFGACNSTERSASANHPPADPVKPTTVQADGARRVTTSELQALLENGQAVVIDVRNQAAYDQAHIRGAKLIPAGEIAERAGELPRDKTIVTYCS